MAAGPRFRARAHYITALMAPLTTSLQKLDLVSNGSQAKQSSARTFDPVNSYPRSKTNQSLISVDRLPVRNDGNNKQSRLSFIRSKKEDNHSEYSDDWESDYSDDWESDVDDESSSAGLCQKSPSASKPENKLTRFVSVDRDAFGAEFCLRRQAAIDNMSYRAAVDSWKVKGLSEIVNLILQLSAGKHPIDRAWIVFYWVSQNIEYDVEAFFSGHIPRQTSSDIFASRKGVCDAFGTIFETLCAGLQLECKKVGGYAKGYGFEAGETSSEKGNHAWNVIRLDGHWYLIDSTWGTGHLDQEKRNKKHLNPYYFLVRPEQMIYRHFPEDARWQLLASPITRQEFFDLPFVDPTYFKLDLEVVSPRYSATVSVDSKLGLAEVLIRAPSNTVFLTDIKRREAEKDSGDSFVHYDAEQQLWQCLFAPQVGGMHTLTIFAARKKASSDSEPSRTIYSSAIHFGMQVPMTFQGKKAFPSLYSIFTERKCQIIEPLHTTLKSGSTVTMRCRIPGARCARLMLDGQWLSEDLIKDDLFQRKFTVPKREIILYAIFSDKKTDKSYDGLCKYVVN